MHFEMSEIHKTKLKVGSCEPATLGFPFVPHPAGGTVSAVRVQLQEMPRPSLDCVGRKVKGERRVEHVSTWKVIVDAIDLK